MSEMLSADADTGGIQSDGPTEELQKLGVYKGIHGLRPACAPSQAARALAIEDVVPGQEVQTPYGTCFLVQTDYRLDHIHGARPLSSLSPAGRPTALLAHLAGDDSLAERGFTSAIFFDIETTGLGIGAGMYAFLIGFGTFEDDRFRLRQYFMRDYHEEQALLYALSADMPDAGWWISFNGRNFDLPVLRTRFICAGYPDMPLSDAPHLDLLYPARRLWRSRLSSCALSSLEANVLGLTRESDVPGWMIPDLYFDYLRFGDVLPLRQVFVHNALDILSLVTLAAEINGLLRDAFEHDALHPLDAFSLASIYERLGQSQQARQAYEWALAQRLPLETQREALCRLSLLHKRTGDIERAVRIWHTLRAEGSVFASVELAKYYEHQERDYLQAAELVREALASASLAGTGQCAAVELEHRLARLMRKLGDGGLPMPQIESYSFGRITVDGKTYTDDLIILPTGVRPGWWRKEGHNLHQDDLQEVVNAKASILVIGTGNLGRMQVPGDTLAYLQAHGISPIVERTAEACQRYNELAQQGRAVAAALHLTC